MSEKKIPSELGTQPVGKLLKQYALPSIIAMLASSLYNIVDSIFIGHGVDALALSGLAVTFPLMNISTAFGAMVGMGSSTLISVKLGQKDYDTAQSILGNAVVMNILMGVIFAAISLIFLDPILYFFGASEATIGYARDYMVIILLGNIITHMYFGFNALLRAMGHPKMAMKATIATVLVNTVLDPLLIFDTINLGFVEFSGAGWGIRGAAIATVAAQCISLVWQVRVMSDKRELLHFRRGIYKLKSYIVKEVLTIGLPPCLMNLASCFVVIFINRGLTTYGGDYAVGAYGIVHKMTFIFVMIVMGFQQAMQPIAGYNYGAKAYDRVTKVLKITIALATCVTTLAFVIGEFFPEYVALIFTSDAQMIEMAVIGMRYNCLLFPIVGFQMVTGSFFQSIAQPGKAIFLSLSRQLLFLVPFIIIFPHFWGINGVWISLPASDLVSSIITSVLLTNYFRKHKV
ncbi:MAG: MATE family efflux transporter [Bacteroidaceae bacterium]|nr:MATE family efflux transporter [Bacteroidaceae bacterium]MBO7267885.1 MATE family efflux transporter [Bacteroidaceae bacterium]